MKATITIPESLNEITLQQYRDFLKVAEDIDGDFLNQRMIEKLCHIPLHEVLFIKLKDVRSIVNDINILFGKERGLIQRFTLGKTEFGMIPNLDEMEFGEYIDLESNISDWDNMNKAMAVMYRPIISQVDGKYEIEPYNGSATYSGDMLHAPLDVVLGMTVFFYRLGNELLQATQSYLVEEVMEMASQSKSSSTLTGGGTIVSTQYRKETLDSLKQLLDLTYTNV